MSSVEKAGIGLSAIAQGCHDLTMIILYYSQSILDIDPSALAQGYSNLTHISLCDYYRVSDIDLCACLFFYTDIRSYWSILFEVQNII